MAGKTATKRRGLTREAIVKRGLEIGEAEGLDAVSLRRLAVEFDVTPMALYRHVKDKQDLVNAMTEVVLDGLDLTVGFRPSMHWTDRARKAMNNLKEQMDARPLAIPLSIAYSGDGPPSFWRMTDDLLGVLLEAGFKRRDAIVLIRVLSNLLFGYLMLLRQDQPGLPERLGPHELELVRRRMELVQLSLSRDQFPNVVEAAHDMTDVWLTDPAKWWRNGVDLMVFGLEAMLDRSTPRRR